MDEQFGCVYRVGAGCGRMDMITVRSLRLLKICQVVVYDDLITEELLAQIPGMQKIYVGKRRGKHSIAQDEICSTLIEKARMGK